MLAIFADELDAIHHGHIEIGDDRVHSLAGGLGIAIGAIDRLDDIKARCGQCHDHHLPDGR
ncbi:hypothetical protein D3C73_1637180 [compost metagenome]